MGRIKNFLATMLIPTIVVGAGVYYYLSQKPEVVEKVKNKIESAVSSVREIRGINGITIDVGYDDVGKIMSLEKIVNLQYYDFNRDSRKGAVAVLKAEGSREEKWGSEYPNRNKHILAVLEYNKDSENWIPLDQINFTDYDWGKTLNYCNVDVVDMGNDGRKEIIVCYSYNFFSERHGDLQRGGYEIFRFDSNQLNSLDHFNIYDVCPLAVSKCADVVFKNKDILLFMYYNSKTGEDMNFSKSKEPLLVHYLKWNGETFSDDGYYKPE